MSTIDALNEGHKRTKVMNAQMVLKLPQAVKDLIREQAEGSGVSDATIIRWALADYFDRRGIRS